MSKFGNLKQYEIDPTKSVKYSITDIEMGGKTPYLMVKPATQTNKPYTKAQLKSSNQRIQRQAAKGISLEGLEANREDDKAHYPKFIITGWGNVFDDEGNDVPFTVENCAEFLEALPDWVFDGVRAFCSVPTNFADEADEEDVGN